MPHRLPLVSLLASLWLSFSPFLEARAQPAPLHAAVEALVQPYHELAMFDGVILLARGDSVVHHAAYGPAVAEWNVPLMPDARFRVASIAKPFTAVAVGLLVERGLVTLDTPIDRFAPSLPEADRITVRHLLTHRSGVVHLNDLEGYDIVMRGPVALDSLVRWIARQPLDFAPGSDYRYSNGGYALLAHVIEQVSGQSYGSFLDEHIAAPLGLDDTEHERLGTGYPRLARGYQPGTQPGARAPATYVAPDVKVGGGSLVASAPDLLRFVRSLDAGTLLPAALADSLLGAGPVRYLSGRAPGYNAVVMRNRPQDLTVVVLSNSYAVTANSLAPMLMALLAGGAPAAMPLVPGASATDWSGRYRWPATYDNDFQLYRAPSGWVYDEGADGDVTAAVPLVDGTLLLPLYDVRCRLAGADLTCTAPWSGQPLVLERIP